MCCKCSVHRVRPVLQRNGGYRVPKPGQCLANVVPMLVTRDRRIATMSVVQFLLLEINMCFVDFIIGLCDVC